MSKTRTIEVFRPGTFRSMQGEVLDFSADTLRAAAAAYDPALSPAPAVVGHPAIDAPAYGWAAGFTYDDKRGRLLADVGELEPQFADAVAAGRYKRISLSFFSPNAPANPKPGTWYPKHIGFLGAAAPAVSGLKPVSFAGDQTGVVEFASGDAAASMFRQLREFIIEKFGLEAADQVLPSWQIEWLDEADPEEADATAEVEPTSSFAAPPARPVPPALADAVREAALAAREAEIARRETEAAARERQAIQDANASFADTLVAEGRVLPVQRDRLTAALNAIDITGGATVSFAEGDPQPAGGVIRAILKELPKVVPLGQSAPVSPEDNASADFAVPYGATVNGEALELLARAEAHMREHKVSLNEAVKAVSR